jgi:hypothetical protein
MGYLSFVFGGAHIFLYMKIAVLAKAPQAATCSGPRWAGKQVDKARRKSRFQ